VQGNFLYTDEKCKANRARNFGEDIPSDDVEYGMEKLKVGASKYMHEKEPHA
jgi:hypothetical protein